MRLRRFASRPGGSELATRNHGSAMMDAEKRVALDPLGTRPPNLMRPGVGANNA